MKNRTWFSELFPKKFSNISSELCYTDGSLQFLVPVHQLKFVSEKERQQLLIPSIDKWLDVDNDVDKFMKDFTTKSGKLM